MNFVFDTSILIDKFRGGEKFGTFISGIVNPNTRIYLPSIVQFEIMSGKSTRDKEIFRRITAFFDKMEKIDLTENISRRAGFLYRDLELKIGVVDYIVAATALEINAQVVTLNKKHFSQISGLLLYPF